MIRTKRDIVDEGDIRLLVNTFYYRASRDGLLGFLVRKRKPGAIQLAPLYQYWESVLLHEADAEIPFSDQTDVPLRNQHIDRWLSLFHATVDELFVGPAADAAKIRAIRMAEGFRYRMQLTPF